jgi:hypothetical protein
LEQSELVVELVHQILRTTGCITSWDALCHALRERFYPRGYLQNILSKWLQLASFQLSLYKATLTSSTSYTYNSITTILNEVLIIKFNAGLLFPLHREVDIFESSSLDKEFLRALAIERKVAPQTRYPPNRTQSTNSHPSQPQPYPSFSSMSNTVVWCTFHNTNSHNSAECRAIKNIYPHQTLVAEVTPTEFPKQPEFISLTNPTEVDPSLILMTTPELGHTSVPLFMHNNQIKHKLATLILDNGSQNNLVSQDLVQHLQLPTTPHLDPYQLGWVQRGGPCITIARCCAVTFSIGPFRDIVVCDVSPLDYVDLLLGLPYQQDRQEVYHAKSHQYNLQHE